MRYYLIVGEASGDLHASHLMRELKEQDTSAEFRFFGGDLMSNAVEEGGDNSCGKRVRHYKDLAYMGFIPVLFHLPTIMANMSFCKKDIVQWNPDVVILVDYPGFNLDIAKFIHAKTEIPVYYYISPKIWAWKEYRIKNIKRDVDELFSILPFEVPFFEQKHGYKINYVGNPTAQEVLDFQNNVKLQSLNVATSQSLSAITQSSSLEGQSSSLENQSSSPILAILCGSRRQEIRDNLPKMISVALSVASHYDIVIAGAPSVEPEYYSTFIQDKPVRVVFNETYNLLSCAHAALVTSGTATLETALFRVPQVVCYETGLHLIVGILRKLFLKVPFVSLVNLIGGREIVPELIANDYTEENIKSKLRPLLSDTPARRAQLQGYEEVAAALGAQNAPQTAARLIVQKLLQRKNKT